MGILRTFLNRNSSAAAKDSPRLLPPALPRQASTVTVSPTTAPHASMSQPACPVCSLTDVLGHSDHWECATCGHEWPKEAVAEAARVVKDAHGNVLVDGDTVVLIKDLKLRGSSGVLKQGTKAKNIRIVDGDHEIDCKIDGSAMALKACFVKKA